MTRAASSPVTAGGRIGQPDGWLLYEVALRLPDAKPVEIAMRLRPGPEVVEEGIGETGSAGKGSIEIKKHSPK